VWISFVWSLCSGSSDILCLDVDFILWFVCLKISATTCAILPQKRARKLYILDEVGKAGVHASRDFLEGSDPQKERRGGVGVGGVVVGQLYVGSDSCRGVICVSRQ
jgi:hypothetical protein